MLVADLRYVTILTDEIEILYDSSRHLSILKYSDTRNSGTLLKRPPELVPPLAPLLRLSLSLTIKSPDSIRLQAPGDRRPSFPTSQAFDAPPVVSAPRCQAASPEPRTIDALTLDCCDTDYCTVTTKAQSPKPKPYP